MGLYDNNDAYFTWNGDYAVGDDGDLKDTSDDMLLSLRQELHSVVKSELTDWQMDTLVGASLSDFIGEPNTRENGKAIEFRIKQKIIEAEIALPGDITVRVVPVGIHEIMIMITITTLATSQNKLVVGDKGYVSQKDKHFARDADIYWGILDKRGPGKKLRNKQKKHNKRLSKVRSKVEHPFRIVKDLWGHRKTRYKGLKKNLSQMYMLFALANIFMSRKSLLKGT